MLTIIVVRPIAHLMFKYFNYFLQVFSPLRKSCVLMVVMSLVASLCLFLGLLLIALSIRIGNTVSVDFGPQLST